MKKYIPKFIKEALFIPRKYSGFLCLVIYDSYRFTRFSGSFLRRREPSSIGAHITKEYHVIEKGLALPSPRPGFGKERIELLCELINSAIERDICHEEVALAVDALRGYRDFNRQHDVPSSTLLETVIQAANSRNFPMTGGPVDEIKKDCKTEAGGEIELLLSRRSVRDFSQAPVPNVVLRNAVRAAQFAPCVCNRQAGRIYFLIDAEIKKLALKFQNGNRGFGDSTPVVAIITIDQSEMLEPTERYQHWIDGGMFSQNFLLGLHAQGYGACPLNWSATVGKDKGIRNALGFIPDSETIIMLVAIGGLKDSYKVARSERRKIEEVAKFI